MPAFIALAVFAFVLYCVLDVVLTDASDVRNLPKPAWLVVVVFLPVVGSIAWLLGGRPEGSGRPPGARPGPTPSPSSRGTAHPATGRRPPGTRPTSRPKGPDDDPDFLRSVDERLRRADEDRPEDDA